MITNSRNGKAPRLETKGLSENQNQINAGGISKRFDVSDYAENSEKNQCQKCNPPLVKPRGELRLCDGCRTETEQTAKRFFDNFGRHRKIVKLDCRCYVCGTAKAAAAMSKILPVCRKCLDDLKTKGAIAQSRAIDHATNNFLKNLKRAVTI